ncbi:MAG: glucose-6-phosphate isomerase, partial [Alphaproteobacteria bacterium]|nr:glucose-6-phosphate isomerase [Alphaproteobacteria bacterium]
MGNLELWDRYKKYLYVNRDLGLMMDISRMNFGDDYLDKMESLIHKAFKDIDTLESGEIANPDENRMV